SSTVSTVWPTLMRSPFLTLMSFTAPATDDGTSIVALSVSSSRTAWSFAIVSPGETSTRTTSPAVTLSPSSRSVKAVAMGSVPGRIWLVGIDPEVQHGLRHDAAIELSVLGQLRQRRQRDEAAVDLEELPEPGAILAAAEAVGAERADAPRQPPIDAVGQDLQVIGGGDDDAGRVLHRPRDGRDARRLGRVQHVPAVGRLAVAIELLVAGHAPDVGGDVVLLEQLLRRQHLVEDGAAAEKLRAQLRRRVRRRLEPVQALEDALARPFRHRRHLVLLVHHRQVVEDAFLIAVHAADAVLDDHRELVGKRRIVG